MPSGTAAENRLRKKADKAAEKEMNLYYKTTSVYKVAKKLVHSYTDMRLLNGQAHYEETCNLIKEREEEEESRNAFEKKRLAGGCSLDFYSVDELRLSYQKFFENSLNEDLLHISLKLFVTTRLFIFRHMTAVFRQMPI